MAMLRLRDGRELQVKETVEQITVDSKTLVEVTEVRKTVKRKFMTPVDTKAEFEVQEIKHKIAVASIMDIQPTPEEAKLAPVHGTEHAKMPAVSGPFKHDYKEHVFCYDKEGHTVAAVETHAKTKCDDGCSQK